MSNPISGRTELVALADVDEFYVVDKSDPEESVANGSGRRIIASNIAAYILALASLAELIRDTIGAAATAGTGITITPSDVGDTITIAIDTAVIDERARDALGAALTAGSGISITPNDGADTITIAVDSSAINELARDAIGSALTGGTGVTITPNDGGDTITISLHADLVDLITQWGAASASGPATLILLEDTDNGTNKVTLTAPSSLASDVVATLPSTTGVLLADTTQPVTLTFVLSDETTALTTGEKLRFRMPFAMTLYAGNAGVRLHVTTVSSSGAPQVDIKDSGTTIFSTKPTIDANENSSLTAATACVLSDTALADDAELTFIVDTAGTGTTGLKVTLRGTRT